MERQIRVVKTNGDVRQGRYLRRTKWQLELHDGLRRVIKLYDIADIVAVPGCPPGTCAADAIDAEYE